MNAYVKAFLERLARLNISDSDFPMLAKEALEAEYGGEIDSLLADIGQDRLAIPAEFAEELFKVFGKNAAQYCVAILKYAESGQFRPEEEAEVRQEEEMLETIIQGLGFEPSPQQRKNQASEMRIDA